MPASAWIRPLVIAALIAFVTGVLGLLLGQTRLAPIALFLGELLTILAAIAWNTPKLPLFSETRPIIPVTADTPTNGAAQPISADEATEPQAASATTSRDDAS